MMSEVSPTTLHYAINKPRGTITLNLYEAERYEPAIIVQSLVGNLVYYSNQGRYEPRLAKSWKRSSPEAWTFELHQNLVAENGEAIDARSFKQSIERTLRFLTRTSSMPVLSGLKGFKEFSKGGPLSGISAEGDFLTFTFEAPVRDGLLQVLSFAPFGYIASENLNGDGSWKNDSKFISSGPYQVKAIEIGKTYVIERRPNWIGEFSRGAPVRIEFSVETPSTPLSGNWVVDAFTTEIQPPDKLKKYPLIPEYLNPIVLGNLKSGYFSSIENRKGIRSLIEKYRNELPASWGPHSRSDSFYPSQKATKSDLPDPANVELTKPQKPVVIEGSEPPGQTPSGIAWQVLRKALEHAKIPFEFAGNQASMKHISNQSFDIRLRGASTGGGVEAWGLNILFCSELGPKFPDPTGKICGSISDFEMEKMSEKDFADLFAKIVETDSAIIPVTHYGIQLFLSDSIKRSSLNPTLSIIRFDKLEME